MLNDSYRMDGYNGSKPGKGPTRQWALYLITG